MPEPRRRPRPRRWRAETGSSASSAASLRCLERQGTPPTLRFDAAGGRLSGSGGCNRITGTYQVDGDRLTFGPIASTRMACPEAMDQEQGFLKALAGVTSYRISGGTLELLDGSNVLARLRAGAA